MHAKTKTKHNMGELSHGRAWELKEEERQEQAGKGCDEASPRPLEQATCRVTRMEARGVGYWGSVGDSLKSR